MVDAGTSVVPNRSGVSEDAPFFASCDYTVNLYEVGEDFSVWFRL